MLALREHCFCGRALAPGLWSSLYSPLSAFNLCQRYGVSRLDLAVGQLAISMSAGRMGTLQMPALAAWLFCRSRSLLMYMCRMRHVHSTPDRAVRSFVQLINNLLAGLQGRGGGMQHMSACTRCSASRVKASRAELVRI